MINCNKKENNNLKPTDCESSASEPGGKPLHYPWGSVSSLHMNSKGKEIIYRVDDDRDWIWARRLKWVVDQHLDRAEDEQSQPQSNFEAFLRLSQSKEARERKYDQEHIAYFDEQLETAHRTIWVLLVVTRRPSKFLSVHGISPLR
jgi:hypothetical protein